MSAETQPGSAVHWRHLSSEERLKDPGFAAHLAESRAACGLPARITDPVVLTHLANLMKAPKTFRPAGESEAAA